jgi:hypothetical protein
LEKGLLPLNPLPATFDIKAISAAPHTAYRIFS